MKIVEKNIEGKMKMKMKMIQTWFLLITFRENCNRNIVVAPIAESINEKDENVSPVEIGKENVIYGPLEMDDPTIWNRFRS